MPYFGLIFESKYNIINDLKAGFECGALTLDNTQQLALAGFIIKVKEKVFHANDDAQM